MLSIFIIAGTSVIGRASIIQSSTTACPSAQSEPSQRAHQPQPYSCTVAMYSQRSDSLYMQAQILLLNLPASSSTNRSPGAFDQSQNHPISRSPRITFKTECETSDLNILSGQNILEMVILSVSLFCPRSLTYLLDKNKYFHVCVWVIALMFYWLLRFVSHPESPLGKMGSVQCSKVSK